MVKIIIMEVAYMEFLSKKIGRDAICIKNIVQNGSFDNQPELHKQLKSLMRTYNKILSITNPPD